MARWRLRIFSNFQLNRVEYIQFDKLRNAMFYLYTRMIVFADINTVR